MTTRLKGPADGAPRPRSRNDGDDRCDLDAPTVSIEQRGSTRRTTRTITAALAAVVVTAAVAGPAAADSHAQRTSRHAERSTLAVSKAQRYVTAITSLTPAQLATAFGTVIPQAKADVNVPLPGYVPLPSAFADTATRPAKANVYVPPAAAFTDTVAPATAPATSQPVHGDRRDASPNSSGFDWASAAIGAAATGGLILIAVGGFGAVHRARIRPAR
jgi:hypothetical protein